MNIATVLRQRALDHADLDAIVEAGGRITFRELDGLAAQLATRFRERGLNAGDRVLVLMPMSIGLYATLVALWRTGAVAVFLDPSAGLDHVARCCAIARPRGFVGGMRAHLLRLVSPAVRAIPIRFAWNRRLPGAALLRTGELTGSSPAIADARDDTPALITFTSGSTGQPKAAVRSHGFLLAQHRVLADDLNLREGQRDLSALPIFVLANLASAVTSIVPDADLRRPGAIQPARLLRQIRQQKPTRLAASPALLERLARHAAWHRERLDEFDEIYTGGAPVFPRLLALIAEVAARARVVAVYGSTEAEPIAAIAWEEITADDLAAMRAGAGLLAGRPVSAISLRIIPERWGDALGPFTGAEFDALNAAPGAAGEIVVAGDHVLRGYLDGVGDAETKFRVEGRVWHRTGDAGYLDAGGRLWLLGRASARVSDARGVLYPFAVECAADSVDGVRRCAFVEHDGNRVLVAEVDGAAETIRPALAGAVAWAGIDAVHFVDALPVDPRHNAKVDYPALRRLLRKITR